jgi:hypothetical protein
MSGEIKAMRRQKPPQSDDVRGYIEDQLDVLARLASDRGERRLAVALQMAALEAARSAERA